MPEADPIFARLEFSLECAREAGELTLRAFRSRRFAVDAKDDGSHVTDADRDAETLIRDALERVFPDDGVFGEEHGERAGTSGYRWLIDPIDGTASFVHGVPLYGTLIAVERDGASVAGVIHMPALGETVHAARGHGAWHTTSESREAAPARVSTTRTLRESLLVMTAFDYFAKAGREAVFARLARAFARTRGWSDCYAHLLVATGRAEAAVEPSIKPWDVAPMTVILEEAGGRYTDWHGRASAYGPDGASTNGLIHEELLATLQGGDPRTGRYG